jgi:hypothetical protein
MACLRVYDQLIAFRGSDKRLSHDESAGTAAYIAVIFLVK